MTLDRAIKYGKTIGCKGCDRIAEGIPHSDACHERFRILLQEERMAKEASARGIKVQLQTRLQERQERQRRLNLQHPIRQPEPQELQQDHCPCKL